MVKDLATEAGERVIRDWASAWADRHSDRLIALFADDGVLEDVALQVLSRGRLAIQTFVNGIFDAVPDLALHLTHDFTSGPFAAAEWIMSGTLSGSLLGLPATGKSFSVRGAAIFELRDGQISRSSIYCDMATLVRQLGTIDAAS
jgi:steroid delta-isomerase-like uncharacterized protein